MTLEEEVKRLIYQATMSAPPAIEALVTGTEAEATTDGLFQIAFERMNGLEQAILRLARELDQPST